MLITLDIKGERKIEYVDNMILSNAESKIWIEDKPCKHAVMMSFPSAEQNDNIFQNLPVDKSHHEDTA